MNKLVDDSNLRCEGEWNLIWNLSVPHRVKLHLWRACRNTLPTKDQLSKRRVNCGSFCTRCSQAIENTWHIFVSCPLAVQYWRKCGLMDKLFGAYGNQEMLIFGRTKIITQLQCALKQRIFWMIGRWPRVCAGRSV